MLTSSEGMHVTSLQWNNMGEGLDNCDPVHLLKPANDRTTNPQPHCQHLKHIYEVISE